ncbi:MAG: amidohydrolase family protein [bacterium]
MKSACWFLLFVLALGPGAALPVLSAEEAPASGSVTQKVPILLRNVMIFDPAAGAMRGPQDVLIEGSHVSAVGKVLDGGGVALEIDCAGRYAVAGLFDCHTHLAHLALETDDSLRTALAAFALCGIAHVRDVGGPVDVLSRMAQRVASGEIAGPEIFYSGPMLEASPLTHGGMNQELPGFTVPVDTAHEADSILADLAGRGAAMVKTFGRFDRDVYAHLLAAAARCSLRVVHDPGQPLFNPIPMDLAIDLGVTSIEHAKAPWPVVLKDDLGREHDSLLVSGSAEARMDFVARVAAMDTASISRDRLRRLGQKMIERDAYLCPTIHALMSVEDEAFRQVRKQIGAEEIPEEIKAFILQQIHSMQAVSRLVVAEFATQGVKMLVGQDGCEAGDTFVEMTLLSECGVSEAEIIRGATIYPARWLGVDDRLGSIAPGKEASLLVVEGNPIEDITRLASPSLVIHKGRILLR